MTTDPCLQAPAGGLHLLGEAVEQGVFDGAGTVHHHHQPRHRPGGSAPGLPGQPPAAPHPAPVGQVRPGRARPGQTGLEGQRAGQVGAQQVLPGRAHPGQIGQQDPQQGELAVPGVGALQTLAPLPGLLRCLLGSLLVRPRPEVVEDVTAQEPDPGRPRAVRSPGPLARPSLLRVARLIGRCARLARLARPGAPTPQGRHGRSPVIDGAVEPLHIPLEQGLLHGHAHLQRLQQELFEPHRGQRQFQPRQVTQGAVDDGIRAAIEELQVDIAQQTAQGHIALPVLQGDMQHLVGDQARLLRQGQGVESRAIEDGGRRRWPAIRSSAPASRSRCLTQRARPPLDGAYSTSRWMARVPRWV